MTKSPEEPSTPPVVPSRSPAMQSGSRRSILFICIAAALLLLHIPAFMLVKVAAPIPKQQQPPPAFIQFQDFTEDSRERLLEDQALLLDSEPLFLPTQWNYASQARGNVPLPSLAGAPFTPYPEQLHLGHIDFFPETTRPTIPDVSEAILQVATVQDHLFSGFGSAELLPRPLGERQAFLRFHKLDESAFVIERILRTESEPEAITEELWQPVQLLIHIGIAGPLGPPMLLHSSGNPDIDQYILHHVVQPESTRDLPQGYYRITAGP